MSGGECICRASHAPPCPAVTADASPEKLNALSRSALRYASRDSLAKGCLSCHEPAAGETKHVPVVGSIHTSARLQPITPMATPIRESSPRNPTPPRPLTRAA